MVDGPDDPRRDHGVVADAVLVEHLHGHDRAAPADPGDSLAVVGASGDDPGDSGSVALVVEGARRPVDEVVSRHERAPEIRLARIDAGVDHGHDRLARAAGRNRSMR